jgi:hypothetical protein
MDTTDELTNRAIAIAKARVEGWRVEQHGERDWWAILPDGTVYRAGVGEEQHAWYMIADRLERPYLTDANAAMSLLPDTKWHLYHDPAKGYCAIWSGVPAFPWHYYPTLEEAICQSFMTWHSASAEDGGDGEG